MVLPPARINRSWDRVSTDGNSPGELEPLPVVTHPSLFPLRLSKVWRRFNWSYESQMRLDKSLLFMLS